MSKKVIKFESLTENVSKVSKAGKPYTAAEALWSDGGDVKTKLLFNNSQRDLINTLAAIQPGINIEVDTNEKGDWVSVSAAADKQVTAPRVYTPKTGGSSGGGYTKDPEEGKRISRANSVTNARELLQHNNPKGGVDVKDVIDLAEKLFDYTYNGKSGPKPFTSAVKQPDEKLE